MMRVGTIGRSRSKMAAIGGRTPFPNLASFLRRIGHDDGRRLRSGAGDRLGIWLLGGGIRTNAGRYGYAAVKKPTSSEQPWPIHRDCNAGRAPSCNDTTKKAQLNWGATGRPPRRRCQLARLHGQARRSGDHHSSRSSRALANLIGRLEAAGAPQLACGAVGERRWSEWVAGRCAESGPTHCAAPCSWERQRVHVCLLVAC